MSKKNFTPSLTRENWIDRCTRASKNYDAMRLAVTRALRSPNPEHTKGVLEAILAFLPEKV